MEKDKKHVKFRHELKYLLSRGSYLQLRELLGKVAKLDKNTFSSEGYFIRSLYFDDIYDTAYHEKAAGVLNRKKYRIRIYNYSDSVINLEEKVKFQEYIQKNSCRITKEEYFKIFDSDISFLNSTSEKLKKDYYIQFRNKILRPKVVVDYTREAFTLPYNDIRITFDKGLSAALPSREIFTNDLCSYQVGKDYEFILEIKFNNFLPSHIRELLEMHSTSRLAVSKYLLCREYINRWF